MVRANAIEPGNAFVDYAIQIPCLSRLFCYKIVGQRSCSSAGRATDF